MHAQLILRLSIGVSLLGAAIASQAVVFSFSGQTTSGVTIPGTFTTAPPAGALAASAPFSSITSGIVTLTNSSTVNSNVVFTNGSSTLTVTFSGTSTDTSGTGLFALSSFGTITAGTGVFAPYVSPSNVLTVTSNTFTGAGINFFSVLGNVNPTPEPTSIAALGVGAIALIRRRKKA